MACYARVTLRIEVQGPTGLETVRDQPVSFALGVGDHVDMREYSIATATYQAFTIPTGAKLMLVYLGDAVSMTLKGNTADTGVPVSPSSGPLGLDLVVPLGASPTPGILNGHSGTQSVWVAFL
jgi:hypothetical protein